MDGITILKQYWIHLPFLVHIVGLSVSDPCTAPVDLTAVTSTKRTFTSPNYPDKYPNNVLCVWRISAASTSDVVKVQVENSRLEKQFGAYGCAFDYVAIYDGLGTSHKKLGQWCGASKPSFVSSGSSITVVFYSDRSYGTTGFEISYVSGPAEYFRDEERTTSGTTMMGMVGYLVLVLAVLSGAMLAMRILLNKFHWCKCLERPRQRVSSIFTRQPRRTGSGQDRTSSTTTEVFVLPVPPPSYEESGGGLDGSPPPYSAIALTPVTPSPEVIHDNPAFGLDRELNEFSPPPPYESVAGEMCVDTPGNVPSYNSGNIQSSNSVSAQSSNSVSDSVQCSNSVSVQSSISDNVQSSISDNVQSSYHGNIEGTHNVTTTTNSSSGTSSQTHGDTDVV